MSFVVLLLFESQATSKTPGPGQLYAPSWRLTQQMKNDCQRRRYMSCSENKQQSGVAFLQEKCAPKQKYLANAVWRWGFTQQRISNKHMCILFVEEPPGSSNLDVFPLPHRTISNRVVCGLLSLWGVEGLGLKCLSRNCWPTHSLEGCGSTIMLAPATAVLLSPDQVLKLNS